MGISNGLVLCRHTGTMCALVHDGRVERKNKQVHGKTWSAGSRKPEAGCWKDEEGQGFQGSGLFILVWTLTSKACQMKMFP